MLAMPGMRGFAVSASQSADGISCNAQGVFIGHVPLLEKAAGRWMPRRVAELNDELTTCYRLPVEIAAKANSLSLIAHALNRGDLAMAAIAAVQMQIPDPPRVAKRQEKPEDIVRRARELARGGLLKLWDPALHPRAGVPPNPGWFAPDGQGDDAATAEPVAMRWPPWQKPEILEGGGGGGAPRGQLEFPSIRWPWSRAPSSGASPAVPKPLPPVDAQPTLPFPEGLPEQRAPATDADVSVEDSPTEVPARGGRLGNAATRAQNAEIAAELEAQEYKITHGAGKEEEYIRGGGPGTLGGTFVDITAVNKVTRKILRIQTVDTLADGVTPTLREQEAAARIRQARPNDELILIPKRRMP
ncbi:MAG TPA: hypothetical protein VGH13_24830 [Xanthobacteraceae bacterium]